MEITGNIQCFFTMRDYMQNNIFWILRDYMQNNIFWMISLMPMPLICSLFASGYSKAVDNYLLWLQVSRKRHVKDTLCISEDVCASDQRPRNSEQVTDCAPNVIVSKHVHAQNMLSILQERQISGYQLFTQANRVVLTRSVAEGSAAQDWFDIAGQVAEWAPFNINRLIVNKQPRKRVT